ncbi:MAG: Gfo/Idh/MocA family oxidoreductase, partial [Chloroflexota bacterium]
FRWQPWYREMKNLLDANELGDPFTFYFQMRQGDGWGDDAYLARQPFFREYKRLLIYETGVHFIDTFRYLFGEITAVYANLRQLNPVIKGEDSGQVIFHHANGVVSIFDANRYNEAEAENTRYTFGTARLDGRKGHLEMDFDGDLRFKKLGKSAKKHPYTHTRNGFAGDCVFALQRHFVEQLKAGKPFENNGPDYLKTMKVVDAVYQSNLTKSLIMID